MITNLMQQIFLSIPSFPDPLIKDPTVMPHFTVIDKLIQQEASSSAPIGRGHNPLLGNITEEITNAMDLLKGKATREVNIARSSYNPHRLPITRLSEGDRVQYRLQGDLSSNMSQSTNQMRNETRISSEPGSAQTINNTYLGYAHADSRKEEEDGGVSSGDKERTNDRNPNQP